MQNTCRIVSIWQTLSNKTNGAKAPITLSGVHHETHHRRTHRPTCDSNGKKEHPAFSNGFTSQEWADMDSESSDHYFAGDYDVVCNDCDSSGKIQLPDMDSMPEEEREKYVAEQRDIRAMQREQEAERRFGC